MVSYKISDIEGIGPKLSIKLERVGITNLDSLLQACATKKGREEVSLKTGITEEKLHRWVNMADLYRIQGIGIEYTELLEAAGVDALDELKTANPQWLHERMKKINSSKKFVLQVPSLEEIGKFIEQARSMDPVVMN